jgi:hypothetical protein
MSSPTLIIPGVTRQPTGTGSANLSLQRTATAVVVVCDGGTDAEIPAATPLLAGIMTATMAGAVNGLLSTPGGTVFGRAPGSTGPAGPLDIGDGLLVSGGRIDTSVQMSLEVNEFGLKLVNDETTPGSLKYYGTSAAGVKGFHPLPSGSGATNLGVTAAASQLTVTSSSGSSAVLPAATTLLAGVMTSSDKTKLDGVASGATANATNAQLRDRSTHTGVQPASSISDLAANTRMQVQSMFIAGSNVTLTPSGSGDSLQISIDASPGGSGSTNLGVTTAASQLTVTSSSGTSAVLPAATTSLAGVMTSTDKTKLDGIAPGSTANATNAELRDRGTHTGSQLASTISDFAASVRAQLEAALVAGTNISVTGTGTGATRQLVLASSAAGSSSGGDLILTFRASQLIPATTNGAGVDSQETTTGGAVNRDYLTFPAGVNRYAWLELAVPTGWNSGFEYRAIWRTAAVSGTVQWEAAARAYSDGNDETGAVGSGVLVGDAAIGYGSATMISDWSTAVPVSGAVLDGLPMMIRIGRLGASTAPLDNLSNTAFLHMIQIRKVSAT